MCVCLCYCQNTLGYLSVSIRAVYWQESGNMDTYHDTGVTIQCIAIYCDIVSKAIYCDF